ncbi:WD40-repeat-containing domain protein [Suillus subalutaceus]|uniref:WD40-repeat-containing domain protein n=1 Tax=Suillus subalutaceus TaxID=48586 RepID=UPI001B875037|nr:WD40-repeat-containing domain protein [Suillus subalutaceus]KAG1851858.1 WD40-repeat-containing domain protein [Suillus subalutaceus]
MTWNTAKWEQIAVLVEHTFPVYAIAISPNGRILASASFDSTARLWNLDDGQPTSPSLQHARPVQYVSFSDDGKLLATGCSDQNAYTWDVAAIVREAGLNDLLSDPKANKLALHADATRRPPAYRVPQGFFDGAPPDVSQFSALSGPQSSSEPQGSTLLRRLFYRSPPNAHDTSPSSPFKWAQALLKRPRQSSESAELQGRGQVAEVPYAKGKRPNVAKPSSQQQATGSSSSTTPAAGDNTAATNSAPSRPDVILRQAGLWTRFWLFIGCLSPEYQDGRH